jgi:mono/diheme cytochrome c family protein
MKHQLFDREKPIRSATELAIITVLLFAALLFFGSALANAQKRKPKAQTAREKSEDLYRSNCARCHGADGRGDTPLGVQYVAPDFTDPEWWKKNAENTKVKNIRATIGNGKGKMPAFAQKLKRSEIDGLVKVVQRFKKQAAPASAQK